MKISQIVPWLFRPTQSPAPQVVRGPAGGRRASQETFPDPYAPSEWLITIGEPFGEVSFFGPKLKISRISPGSGAGLGRGRWATRDSFTVFFLGLTVFFLWLGRLWRSPPGPSTRGGCPRPPRNPWGRPCGPRCRDFSLCFIFGISDTYTRSGGLRSADPLLTRAGELQDAPLIPSRPRESMLDGTGACQGNV